MLQHVKQVFKYDSAFASAIIIELCRLYLLYVCVFCGALPAIAAPRTTHLTRLVLEPGVSLTYIIGR